MNIQDLPTDILTIVFLYLDPADFLSLCQSSKALYQTYRQDSIFWRTKTSETFRTPISPLLKADGARWYWLYKRLRTQTKLYTWGQGVQGNLGPGRGAPRGRLPPGRGRLFRGLPTRGGHGPVVHNFSRVNSYWPTETHVPDEVGAIADLQCGGWSTAMLSSQGKLYVVGLINGKDGMRIGQKAERFEQLRHPDQESSAIASFSAGRTHILALSDAGTILSWDRIDAQGHEPLTRHGDTISSEATRVVAGWAESSAYVPSRGIIYWTPIVNDALGPTREVKERIIPGTSRRTLNENQTMQVDAYIVLENYIVFIINNRLWATDITHDNNEDLEPRHPSFQVPGFHSTDISNDTLKDIQGSFRTFAVFTSSGRVLKGTNDYLRQCADLARQAHSSDPESTILPNHPNVPTTPDWPDLQNLLSSLPASIPALQHTGVISLAFGDYHYHALHDSGRITTYGVDPQCCGALGLGERDSILEGPRESTLRGAVQEGVRDAKLLPVAEKTGREIWFEHEKRDWLRSIARKGLIRKDELTARSVSGREKLSVVSEWVEQTGRRWRDGPPDNSRPVWWGSEKKASEPETTHSTNNDGEDEEIESYFALAIGAAGWHSGALVLVDEEKAEEVRRKWLVPEKSDEEKQEKPVADEEQGSGSHNMPGHFDTAHDTHEDEHHERYVWDVDEGDFAIEAPEGWEGGAISTRRAGEEGHEGSKILPWRGTKPTLEELGLPLPHQ